MRRLEVVVYALGGALVLVYAAARLGAEQARAAGIQQLTAGAAALGGEELAPPEHPASSDAAIDQSLWSPARAAAFVTAAAAPGAPDAVLRIPSVRLEVPVYAGTSELNLNRGAAHIEGTAAPGTHGNVGIAAHRDGFFRSLEELALDAAVHLQTAERTLRYRVVDIRIVTPDDVHVLAPTAAPSITLVTCYPFYFLGSAPERYIVRAELEPALSRSAALTESISADERLVGRPTRSEP